MQAKGRDRAWRLSPAPLLRHSKLRDRPEPAGSAADLGRGGVRLRCRYEPEAVRQEAAGAPEDSGARAGTHQRSHEPVTPNRIIPNLRSDRRRPRPLTWPPAQRSLPVHARRPSRPAKCRVDCRKGSGFPPLHPAHRSAEHVRSNVNPNKLPFGPVLPGHSSDPPSFLPHLPQCALAERARWLVRFPGPHDTAQQGVPPTQFGTPLWCSRPRVDETRREECWTSQ